MAERNRPPLNLPPHQAHAMVTQWGHHTPSLLDLGGRLVGELARLLDQRFELLKAELRQDAVEVARGVGLVLAGVLGASVGAALLLVALGLWVGDLVGSRPAGLAIVGGGLGVLGGAASLFGARSLGRQRLIPQTVRELRRDAEWLRHEA